MPDSSQIAKNAPPVVASPRAMPVEFNAVVITRIVLVLGACLLIGVLPYLFTGEETEIVTYSAPKEATRKLPPIAPEAPGEPGRLWGVIVPREKLVWYFKLTGPIDDVKPRESALRQFLETSVQFPQDSPQWTLPEGWTEQPGDDMRFGTVVVPTENKPLELTITPLPRGGALDKILLDNINRWRDQLTLPALKQDELAATTETIEVAGVKSTLVSLEGVLKPKSMTRPPFAR